MSWQGYVDNLMAPGQIDHVSINDEATGALWAASPDFVMSPEEVLKIVTAIKTDNVAETCMVNGAKIMYFVGNDANMARGKGPIIADKKYSYAFCLTQKSLITSAVEISKNLEGICCDSTYKIANYLRDMNY